MVKRLCDVVVSRETILWGLAMKVERVLFGSEGFLAALELRRQVLRWPLGLDYSDKDVLSEAQNAHFVLFFAGLVLGCVQVVLPPAPLGVFKIRQMAVNQKNQKTGCGRRLLAFAEAWILERGGNRIELHARETAIDFYRAAGFVVVGEQFEEVGLPHRKMEKALGGATTAAPNF